MAVRNGDQKIIGMVRIRLTSLVKIDGKERNETHHAYSVIATGLPKVSM